MRKLGITVSVLCFCLPLALSAASLSVSPAAIIQGEPALVAIEGAKLADIKSLTFDGKAVLLFLYKSKPTALIGIDLNKKPGNYKAELTLANGRVISKNIAVALRPKVEAPLGLPGKLGGNTPQAATNLVNNLAAENNLLNSLWTNPKKLWTDKFKFPLKSVFITDVYGYSRETGQYNIAHKGTDFRASVGTKVYAMNRGVVRLARNLTVYGNTVVVDHGQGIMTFYMHLSSMNVSEGKLVKRGELLGLSGETGYAESPHLHLSIRIANISIDPMKFMEFFK